MLSLMCYLFIKVQVNLVEINLGQELEERNPMWSELIIQFHTVSG